MNTTKLSSKGQVIIPKPLRVSHQWKPGQKFIVIDTGDGILLRPEEAPFQETTLDAVVSCLEYEGSKKSLQDMEEAIHQGVTVYLATHQ